MTKPNTVILTMDNAHLIPVLNATAHDLSVIVLDTAIPANNMQGKVHCFVDWVLKECSGLEMCQRLRMARSTKTANIIMVMDSRSSEDQRRALRAGADSYIHGPLTAEIILQKTEAFIDTPSNTNPDVKLTHGDLSIDLNAYRVRYKDRNISLPPNEFRVLTHFIENPDRLLTRKALIEMLGKNSRNIDERIVNVWIRRLRQTLSAHHVPDPLRTVRSKGYVMDSIAP